MTTMTPVQRKHPLAKCEDCPLYGADMAQSSGPRPARVSIVSRSPGGHDVRANAPFSGPTGKIVDYMFQRNDVVRKDVFCTNVVLCQSDKPPQAAIDACRPRLMAELEEANSDVVIAAGSEPVQELLNMKLSEARGRRHRRTKFSNDGMLTVVATYNPAVVMRDDAVFPDLVSDFRRALNPPKQFHYPNTEYVYSVQRASDVFHVLMKYKKLAIDIESTGLSTLDKLVSVGFSGNSHRGVVFSREFCQSEIGIAMLEAFFTAYQGRQAWHNGKFDCKILREHGIPAVIHDDTMLMSYALDERGGVHTLDYLLQNELDWPYYETPAVKVAKEHGFKEEPEIEFGIVGWTKTNRLRIEAGREPRGIRIKLKCSYPGVSDWSEVYNYNGLDAVGSYCLTEELKPKLAKDNVVKPYEFMIRAANSICEVERHGVYINVQEAERLIEYEVRPRLAELQFRAEAITGRGLNLNSPKQVAEVLYDSYSLREPLYRPGKERSTDAINRDEWLRTITNANARDFIEILDEYKKLDKLRGTYLEGLVERIDSDGRLRCDILLHGTETGRTSSRKPNLQNIPRVDEGGKYEVPNIKSIFQARPGYVILQADYSQAELRCAAVISGDMGLQTVYREGRDLHSEVARSNYGSEFTKEQRFYAKTVNFGILYGIGAYSLSRELTRRTMKEVTEREAARLISNWWEQFPRTRAWVREVHKETRERGELVSEMGRKRRFHLITNENLDHTLKEAVNFKMQSPASDLTLGALCDLVENYQAPVWLCVHDSILMEVPENAVDLWASRCVEAMEAQAVKLFGWEQIPFTTDVQVGTDWGHVKDYVIAA